MFIYLCEWDWGPHLLQTRAPFHLCHALDEIMTI
jgi:hypothetical protein